MPPAKLIVGIHDKPPYAIQRADGHWDGLGVDLWEKIAEKLNWDFDFQAVPYEQLIPQLESGKLSLVVGEIPVLPDVEQQVDFTQPFLFSSVAVAVRNNHWEPDWVAIFAEFLNWSMAKILIGTLIGLIFASLLIWRTERYHKNTHFGGKGWHGFGSALWFSAVTMTSVGYGDKTPNTFLGRLIAFLWMLVGVLIIAAFTGSVASSVATSRLQSTIVNPTDIAHMRNGVMKGETADDLLRRLGIGCIEYESLEQALSDLSAGKLDSVVADRVTLAYLINRRPPDRVRMLPLRFNEYPVAITVQNNSPIRDQINVALLEIVGTPEWKDRLRFWLGHDAVPDM